MTARPTPAQVAALRLAAEGALRGGRAVAWATLAVLRSRGWITDRDRGAPGWPYYLTITDAGRDVLAAIGVTDADR